MRMLLSRLQQLLAHLHVSLTTAARGWTTRIVWATFCSVMLLFFVFHIPELHSLLYENLSNLEDNLFHPEGHKPNPHQLHIDSGAQLTSLTGILNLNLKLFRKLWETFLTFAQPLCFRPRTPHCSPTTCAVHLSTYRGSHSGDSVACQSILVQELKGNVLLRCRNFHGP